MTDTSNVTHINDSKSPLAVILKRRQFIKARLAQIKEERSALSTEENAIYGEDRELAVAEKAVRNLLERGR